MIRLLPVAIATSGVIACATPTGTPQPRVIANAELPGDPSDRLDVDVASLRDDLGSVRCYLYDDPEGFPDSKVHVVGKAVALPSHANATCKFSGLARDHDYAVVITHDENNDDVFQKNVLGMPLEGYGFSNDAKARFSAPSYDTCRFHFGRGRLAIAINAQY